MGIKKDANRKAILREKSKICICVAMRGRNPDHPNDRTAGIPTEQRLEPNTQGICNTLTTVAKDSLVLEINYGNRNTQESS